MRAVLLIVCLAVASLVPAQAAAQREGDSTPSAIDVSRLHADAQALPQLRSLLVEWRGNLVFEHYARGVRPNSPANIKSAAKSIIAALVGIAIEQGAIAGVRQSITTWFPQLSGDRDRRKQTITIEDLLTMRSGLQSTSGPNYGAWVQSRNWVSTALAKPMVADPGEEMQYSTGTSHLLSAILTKATGKSTWQFAQETLATPLGFRLARWTQDPQGIYFGGNEMLLTPKQMMSIGELYLHGGAVGSRQVVPRAWVEASCRPRTRSAFDSSRQYGYGWWIQEIGGEEACFAWGYGGQYILVFRELDLVVTATSSTAVSEERRGHRRRLFEIIGEQIVAPLRR